MSVAISATIGTAVVGGIVSRNAAKRATASAERSEANALAFDQERYDDWKETYGDLESNLADYYGNLTPEYYEAMGLESFQQEYETNMTRMRETLAQRGIVDSGIGASLELQGSLSAAETRAGIRRDSERQVNEDKTSFLQIGLGQNPAQSVSNTLANQAANARNRASSAEVAAGQAVGNAIQVTGTGISDYFKANPVGGMK